MLTEDEYQQIARVMPVLQTATGLFTREFKSSTFSVRIPAGRDVFMEGDQPDGIALLVSGKVRVYKIGETGREITLYRFGQGEFCLLTANAILSQKSFPAIATVETDVDAVFIPAESFREWVRRYDFWRALVFDLLSNRLSSVMEVLNEVAFGRMDRRVAVLLLEKSATQHPIEITHQEIAAELGSSREVISRILGDFTEEGLVKSGRGMIRLLDVDGLRSRTIS